MLLLFAAGFFILAIVFGILGFTAIAVEAAGFAQMLFVLALIVCLMLLAVREARGKYKWNY